MGWNNRDYKRRRFIKLSYLLKESTQDVPTLEKYSNDSGIFYENYKEGWKETKNLGNEQIQPLREKKKRKKVEERILLT